MQKKKKWVPIGYPYPTRIFGYLPGSHRSVSGPNPKLHYSGITRICLEYKTPESVFEKRVFTLSVSGNRRYTLLVFTPIDYVGRPR
jgi:hypothetical protein